MAGIQHKPCTCESNTLTTSKVNAVHVQQFATSLTAMVTHMMG